MRLLYDASALLNFIRRLGEDSLESLRGNYILTLTSYEVANALWREAVLLRRIRRSPFTFKLCLSRLQAAETREASEYASRFKGCL